MYSRDISKKVHSSYLVSAQKGSFTGTVAPLGYKKDPNQHGHLLIDEETAPIIRKILVLHGKLGIGMERNLTRVKKK